MYVMRFHRAHKRISTSVVDGDDDDDYDDGGDKSEYGNEQIVPLPLSHRVEMFGIRSPLLLQKFPHFECASTILILFIQWTGALISFYFTWNGCHLTGRLRWSFVLSACLLFSISLVLFIHLQSIYMHRHTHTHTFECLYNSINKWKMKMRSQFTCISRY